MRFDEKTMLFLDYQGAQAFVDADAAETDAILEANGGKKSDAVYKPACYKFKAVIPIANLSKSNAKMAMIVDRYTALVSSDSMDDIKATIEACGGKVEVK